MVWQFLKELLEARLKHYPDQSLFYQNQVPSKTKRWTAKVGVVTSDKEATVEMPEMRVLYANMKNKLSVAAGGQYKSVALSGKWTSKSGQRDYICKPPSSAVGQKVSFNIKAVTPAGENVSLQPSAKYRVLPAPDPQLFLSGKNKGSAVLGVGQLSVAYGNNVSF